MITILGTTRGRDNGRKGKDWVGDRPESTGYHFRADPNNLSIFLEIVKSLRLFPTPQHDLKTGRLTRKSKEQGCKNETRCLSHANLPEFRQLVRRPGDFRRSQRRLRSRMACNVKRRWQTFQKMALAAVAKFRRLSYVVDNYSIIPTGHPVVPKEVQ
ncbi:MAG: hypothetical protein AMJ54_00230 [Deltaproteobacteria bacterium SG8_13]|nr:MAG: hypothetical protein AMJ54_00230 [Deltaproteobacteria bacterium SG8_13]